MLTERFRLFVLLFKAGGEEGSRGRRYACTNIHESTRL